MRLLRSSLLGVSLVLLAVVTSPASAQAPWTGFEDVPPSNIFFDDIAWLSEQGITRGCNPPANTNFCPSDSVTRGQMAAFLVRALDLPEPETKDWFTDDDISIFEADIDRLAAAGVTQGCNPPENTEFCPDAYVTRAQMATFLVRALGLDVDAGVDWFGDDDGSVHEANVDRLRAAWITFGCNPPNESNYCPSKHVSRQQMAAFLHRAMTQPQPGAAIGVHGYIWPDPLYMLADMVGTFEVKNVGSVPLSDVTGGPYTPEGEEYPWGDCTDPKYFSGPVERLGNGDDLLDPGEIWDWYCGMLASFEMGSIYLGASGTADGDRVSGWAEVRYSTENPFELTATASATAVAPGTKVTWTFVLRNLSPARFVDILLEVRPNNTGSYVGYWAPDVEIVGNGDVVMDPGEVWQYEHAETIWANTFLRAIAWYAPESEPGIGWERFIDTDVVEVIEP